MAAKMMAASQPSARVKNGFMTDLHACPHSDINYFGLSIRDIKLITRGRMGRKRMNEDHTPARLPAGRLDRIEAVNGAVNAIISLRPRDDILAEAALADARLVEGIAPGSAVEIEVDGIGTLEHRVAG